MGECFEDGEIEDLELKIERMTDAGTARQPGRSREGRKGVQDMSDRHDEVAHMVGCHDCGRLYGDEHGFPDLVIPDAAWKVISPLGGGLLCPSCICKRLYDAEIACRGEFKSGPLADPAMSDVERLRKALMDCDDFIGTLIDWASANNRDIHADATRLARTIDHALSERQNNREANLAGYREAKKGNTRK
jgi:hypothetical protein